MYFGQRIWRIGRVQPHLSLVHDAIRFKTNVDPRLPTLRAYTRNAKDLAAALTIPNASTADIHKAYHALIPELKLPENAQRTRSVWRRNEGPILSVEELRYLLIRLLESGREFDMNLVVCIITDMQSFFSHPPSLGHSTVIETFTRLGDCRALHRWYLKMPKLAGHPTASHTDYHSLLELCRKKEDPETLIAAVQTMSRSSTKPNQETLRIALQGLFDIDVPDSTLGELFRTIAEGMVPFDSAVPTIIQENCADDRARAKRLITLYARSSCSVTKSAYRKHLLMERLREEARVKGVNAAVQLFETTQKAEGQEGFVQLSKSAAMFAIVEHAQGIAELEYLSREFGRALTLIDWSILIRTLCRTAKVQEALAVYAEAKTQGVQPDAKMVHPILRQLCRTADSPPTTSDINKAYLIYRDLLQNASSTSKPKGGPDVLIYQCLLRGIAASPSIRVFHDLALSLLQDMQERNIGIEDSVTATSVITLMMKNSESYEEAFGIYRKLRKSLDATGYSIVLDVFCKLELDSIPSVQHYFQIVQDMRSAGHRMSTKVYTIMLQQFARFHTNPQQRRVLASDPELYNSVTASIRRLHDFLTIDGSITPDTALWNQLMDTYQRLDCFGEAFRLWDMLYLSGQLDHTSVSIILDACGYAGSDRGVEQILSRLEQTGFFLNQNNWRSLVECLCRLGKLDEALRVVCMEMPVAGRDVAPDESCVRIIKNFAKRHNLQDEVDKRLKEYLPDLWSAIAAKEEAKKEAASEKNNADNDI